MKKFVVVVALAALVLGAVSSVHAAQTIYGVTGLIETPDDLVLCPGSIGVTANYLSGIRHVSDQFWSAGGAIGLFPRFEVAGVYASNDNSAAVLSAKYRLVNEGVKWPAVTIGIVDAADQLDNINHSISSPSGFLVIGKNLTSLGECLTADPCKPIRGTFGFGTGIYKGVFFGLNFAITQKANIVAEYLSNGIRQDSTVSAAVGYNLLPGLDIRAGIFDFSDFYASATYALRAW